MQQLLGATEREPQRARVHVCVCVCVCLCVCRPVADVIHFCSVSCIVYELFQVYSARAAEHVQN